MNHCIPGQPCGSSETPAVEPPAPAVTVHWGSDQDARVELPLDERRVRAADLESFIRPKRP